MDYFEQGNPNGEPLIFIHGYTDSWHSFSALLPLLTPDYHVFALSLRGHGDTRQPAGSSYTPAAFAADVDAFMEAAGLPSATLIGHSMGTLVARRVALEYPHRVERLVLIAPLPARSDTASVLGLYDAVYSLQEPIDPTFVHEFQASTLYRPVPERYLATLVSESLKVALPVWKEALYALIAEDHSGYLGDISVPTLVLGGEQDALFSVAEQRAVAEQIPNATYKVYPATGHAPHAECPEHLAADLESFLNESCGLLRQKEWAVTAFDYQYDHPQIRA